MADEQLWPEMNLNTVNKVPTKGNIFIAFWERAEIFWKIAVYHFLISFLAPQL